MEWNTLTYLSYEFGFTLKGFIFGEINDSLAGLNMHFFHCLMTVKIGLGTEVVTFDLTIGSFLNFFIYIFSKLYTNIPERFSQFILG